MKVVFAPYQSVLHKFLLDRGIGHIMEYEPLLRPPPPNTNWEGKQKYWEKFYKPTARTHENLGITS
jgi:hypothetical protein